MAKITPLIIALILLLTSSAWGETKATLTSGEYCSFMRISGSSETLSKWLGHEVERVGLDNTYILKVNMVCPVSWGGNTDWNIDFTLERIDLKQ